MPEGVSQGCLARKLTTAALAADAGLRDVRELLQVPGGAQPAAVQRGRHRGSGAAHGSSHNTCIISLVCTMHVIWTRPSLVNVPYQCVQLPSC